ncbi:MAG: DJ-1/PfpI family protein [bacterium]
MKKKLFIVLILLILTFFSLYFKPAETATINKNINVLVLLPKYYGANTMLVLDDMEEFGWEVKTCGIEKNITACSWAGGVGLPTLSVDLLVPEVTDITQYDVLVLANASWRSHTTDIWNDVMLDETAMNLIKTAVNNNIVVYAPCSAPRVLAAAGLLNGVKITGVDQYANEFTAAGANYVGPNILPVIDKNIVTSTRGMYYHYEICEAISTALEQLKKNN